MKLFSEKGEIRLAISYLITYTLNMIKVSTNQKDYIMTTTKAPTMTELEFTQNRVKWINETINRLQRFTEHRYNDNGAVDASIRKYATQRIMLNNRITELTG